jgi:hypothetical protein
MGTIPGPVIECNVGDSVTVHFRNFDTRDGKTVEERTHSLHPHGFVFEPTSDGAYPLSPPDPAQPVAAEKPLWDTVGVKTLKKSDRVPPPPPFNLETFTQDPGGTFTYTWNTTGGRLRPGCGCTTTTRSATPPTSTWVPSASS